MMKIPMPHHKVLLSVSTSSYTRVPAANRLVLCTERAVGEGKSVISNTQKVGSSPLKIFAFFSFVKLHLMAGGFPLSRPSRPCKQAFCRKARSMILNWFRSALFQLNSNVLPVHLSSVIALKYGSYTVL